MARRSRLAAPLLAATALTGLALSTGGSASAAGNAMTASFEVVSVTANFNPTDVARRCPPGFAERGAAIISSTGIGAVQYAGETVDATFVDSHCTVPRPSQPPEVLFARSVTPLDIEAGVMTVTTETGTLTFSYRAPGVFKGDLTLVGPNMHTFDGPYEVTAGTGAFEGASGNGHFGGSAGGEGGPAGITGSITLQGSLRLSD